MIESLIIRFAKSATRRRLLRGEVRTLWGTTPILTLPLLARSDRLLGFKSRSLVFTTYYITRGFDLNLRWLDRLTLSKFAFGRFTNANIIARRLVLYWMMLRYDFFHFFYDRGILTSPLRIGINPSELELLQRANKRVYAYAYGADVRVRNATLALGKYNLCSECPDPGKYCICNDGAGLSNIATVRAHSTAMLSMGDMLIYTPGARNLYYWPVDLNKLPYVGVIPNGRSLRIAHAPNHSHFKGTRYLVAAVQRLQSEGHSIDLINIQGVPNEKVIEVFSSVDIVADQFIAGFHGYTSIEAMALGKVVLCYLRNPEDVCVDFEYCPIINVSPDSLYDTLKNCLVGKVDLQEIGRKGRQYVERCCTIEAVAIRLGQLYLETANLSPRALLNLNRRLSLLKNRSVHNSGP
jgi:hypothetical protein